MNEQELGQKLRNSRLEKGLCLKDIADAASISISMLSQIERGAVNPSIKTLNSITNALGIPLYSLFIGQKLQEVPIVRAGERRVLGFQDSSEVSYELLTPDNQGNIEFCLKKIPPHTATAAHARSHESEEVSYVIEGKVTISLNEKEFEMNEGDSVRIDALVNHRWINRSDDWAVVIFAISPPSF